MGPTRRVYWAVLRRLPRRPARALRRVVVFVGSGGKRRAFPAAHMPIRFTPPEVKLACVVWGVDGEELQRVVERVLAAAGIDPSKVLVVSDCDAVHLFGKHGPWFEYIPPRSDLEAHFPGQHHDSFVGRRIESALEGYRAERVAVFGEITDALVRGLVGETAAEPVKLLVEATSAESGPDQ